MSETLQRAITEIRSGDKEIGRRLLAEVIRNDPRNETAWLWMSSAIDSDDHRRYCLERVLALNPQNQTARQGLEALSQKQVAEPPPAEKPPEPIPSPSVSAPTDARLQIKRLEQEATKKCPYCAELSRQRQSFVDSVGEICGPDNHRVSQHGRSSSNYLQRRSRIQL